MAMQWERDDHARKLVLSHHIAMNSNAMRWASIFLIFGAVLPLYSLLLALFFAETYTYSKRHKKDTKFENFHQAKPKINTISVQNACVSDYFIPQVYGSHK